MSNIGPVEYILIGFAGNQFNGEIAPALAELAESGTIRILDLVFISKNADGDVLSFEYDDNPLTAAFAEIDGDSGGFLDEEDILAAADQLEDESSALLIVWEDVWATKLADALAASGGEIIGGSRVPRRVVQELFEILEGSAS
jgi:uncharacterized membrane protein